MVCAGIHLDGGEHLNDRIKFRHGNMLQGHRRMRRLLPTSMLLGTTKYTNTSSTLFTSSRQRESQHCSSFPFEPGRLPLPRYNLFSSSQSRHQRKAGSFSPHNILFFFVSKAQKKALNNNRFRWSTMMKSLVFSTVLLGIFWSCLAMDSHLKGDEANASTTHHLELSKRAIELSGGIFPALGGEPLAGKVFTTTGSRVTLSNNVVPSRKRKALTFIANPQQISGNTPNLKVDPRLQQTPSNANRALLAPAKVPEESDIVDQSLQEKADTVDSPSSGKDLVAAEEHTTLARRSLIRRSLFEQKFVEKRGLQSEADGDSSRYLSFQASQESQRNLGEFPALGGLKGTVSSAEARKTVEAAKSSPAPNPPPPADSEPGAPPKLSGAQASGKTLSSTLQAFKNHPQPPPGLRFAAWAPPTRLLTISSRGIAVWETADLEALEQAIDIPWLQLNTPSLEPIAAALLPGHTPTRIAVLCNSLVQRTSSLLILAAPSAAPAHILHAHDLPATASELKTSQKLIAVATSAPPALHLFQHDLIPLPCSPILDLAPRPGSGTPVFALGQSRLLVYASSTPHHWPAGEPQPSIAAGPGLAFAAPPPADRPGREKEPVCRCPARHASHSAIIPPASWKHSVAPNLDAIDETARRLGGGLLSGAKYLSSWGQNLWSPSDASPLDPAFSQSAPLPRIIPAARPTPSARPEESAHGNVKVLDLFSPSSAQPLFHFKSSPHPLTFVSLNPASTMLLTASTDGHAFHVFELRPPSRIGLSHPHAPREAAVWHRYKLARGFTAAEVADVVWRWDSKIVAVLTEHGTHHLFAIHPAGGTPTTADSGRSSRAAGPADPLSAIFSPRVHNPRAPPPLSITVSAFEKIKHKADDHAQHDAILSEVHKRAPSVLVHDPSTNTITLYAFERKRTGPAASPLPAAGEETHKKTPSGLSQLMMQQPKLGQSGTTPAAVASFSPALDTFSQSPRILPRSIYLAHQLDFFQLLRPPSAHAGLLAAADWDHLEMRKLSVKAEVRIQPGDLGTDPHHGRADEEERLDHLEAERFVNDDYAPGSPEEVYVGPLRSAVQAGLAPHRVPVPPGFPNGVPAKRGPAAHPFAGLLKLAAADVRPVVGVVHGRVRKQLRRIARRSSSAAWPWASPPVPGSQEEADRTSHPPENEDGGWTGWDGWTFDDAADLAPDHPRPVLLPAAKIPAPLAPASRPPDLTPAAGHLPARSDSSATSTSSSPASGSTPSSTDLLPSSRPRPSALSPPYPPSASARPPPPR
ncbi:hypothetical protein PtB15_2B278 [Puccinia triticina]|nr:hypothetical protein PtB15_2B278 [Puccinia triticina]